jgi:hypothetical protein
MSVALKRVASLTGGKRYTGWAVDKAYNLGNMCSTSDGRAIECSINTSNGNVFVRFAASVGAVIGRSATFGEPTVITTIPVYDDLDNTCGVHICLIDGKLYMTLTHFSADENRLVCSLWCDDTGSGEAWVYKAKISNCASVGRTSFVSGANPGCSPLIKLSNGWLACGAVQYISAFATYNWQLDVCVSTDGGATWSAPVGGPHGSYLYNNFASRTIWEIYPGIIVGNATPSSGNVIGFWTNYGAVYVGTYAAIGGYTGLAYYSTDDGNIYVITGTSNLLKYIGPLPPTPVSLVSTDNWAIEFRGFTDWMARSVISDPAGKLVWSGATVYKYGAVFPDILIERVRNTRHLTDDGWVRSKGGRYMYSDGYWKRVII